MACPLSATGLRRRRGRRPNLRILDVLAAPVATLALIAGVLVAGRTATSQLHAAALLAGWFAAVLPASALIARRRRETAPALAVGTGLAAFVAVTLLGLPSVLDREVAEFVAVGAPARHVDPRSSSVELAAGTFAGLARPGSGRAAVVEVPDGRRVLTMTGFVTSNGPDLRVYLTTGDPASGDLGDVVDLGGLKGNRGDQQYELRSDIDQVRYRHVVVWCRAFDVGFASATLATTRS